MEEDREASNLGPDIQEDKNFVAKQPKRRFVGRKSLANKSGPADVGASIEDGNAVQGLIGKQSDLP
jgi:hypothetical protein